MSAGKAFFRGSIWTVLVTVVGLFPLWLKWFVCIMAKHSYCMHDVVREGVIVIFVTTLVGCILIDSYYCYTKRMNLPRDVEVVIYVLIPFIIFTFMTAAFVLLVREPQNVHLGLLRKTQILAFAIALIYSTFMKFVHFLKEDI